MAADCPLFRVAHGAFPVSGRVATALAQLGLAAVLAAVVGVIITPELNTVGQLVRPSLVLLGGLALLWVSGNLLERKK